MSDSAFSGNNADIQSDSELDAVDSHAPDSNDESKFATGLGVPSHISSTHDDGSIDVKKLTSKTLTSSLQKLRGRKRKLPNPTAPARVRKRQRREAFRAIRRDYKWASVKADNDSVYPRVKIDEFTTAIQHAMRLSSPDDLETQPRLLFWADASGWNREIKASGAGVAYQRYLGESLPWIHHAYSVFGIQKTCNAELFAIERALNFAFLEAQLYYHPPTPEGEETLPIVYVFSDSQPALGAIHRRTTNTDHSWGQRNEILNMVMTALNRLVNMSILVEFRWIPGHAGVEGNEIADKLATWGKKYASWIPNDRNHTEDKSIQAHLAPSDIDISMKPRKKVHSNMQEVLRGVIQEEKNAESS